jgi:hypothetical protein
MKQLTLAAFFVLILTPRLSHADTITFNGLTGPNLAPMPNPYVEGNFRVTPTSGSWFQGQLFGNPVPSIFSNSAIGVVDVTSTGGDVFTFSQVDLGDAGFLGGTGFTVQGRLGGTTIFSTSGSLAANTFTTILSPNPTATIDDLRIIMTMSFTSYNIDNIQVTPGAFVIPEPSSLVLLTIGLLCAGAGFRRSRIPRRDNECLKDSAGR